MWEKALSPKAKRKARERLTAQKAEIQARAEESMKLLNKWRPHPGINRTVSTRRAVNTLGNQFRRERNFITPYEEYRARLNSPEWQELRTKLIIQNSYCCQKCKNQFPRQKLHLHHKHYGSIGKETENDLMVLCELCHKTEHDIETALLHGFKLKNSRVIGKPPIKGEMST
jgi:5-methylcytosine-specific restriction endonuclease McrA